MTTNNESQIVVQISGKYLYHLTNVFEEAFPAEKDELLKQIPEIRRQMEKFQIHHEEEHDPNGYLKLDRKTAEHLAELLENLTSEPRGSYEVEQTASEIREQLQENQDPDPDIRVINGSRYAWAEAAAKSDENPYILLATRNGSQLRHPDRFTHAYIGNTPEEMPIYQIDLSQEQLKTVLELHKETVASFSVRINEDKTLSLVDFQDR